MHVIVVLFLCLTILCVARAPLKADSIVKMTEVDKLGKTTKMQKNIYMYMYRLSEILTDVQLYSLDCGDIFGVMRVQSNLNFTRPVTVRLTKLLTNGSLFDIPDVRYELGNFIM